MVGPGVGVEGLLLSRRAVGPLTAEWNSVQAPVSWPDPSWKDGRAVSRFWQVGRKRHPATYRTLLQGNAEQLLAEDSMLRRGPSVCQSGCLESWKRLFGIMEAAPVAYRISSMMTEGVLGVGWGGGDLPNRCDSKSFELVP